jgi:hypothetical protein
MSVDQPQALGTYRCPRQRGNRGVGQIHWGRRQRGGGVALLSLLLAGLATPALAQQGPALVQPVELCPNGGVLSASLSVEMQKAPVYDPTTNAFTSLPVRTYNLDQTGTWWFCSG